MMSVDIQNYDVRRTASIYFNTSGERCWTKAWFNGNEKGEPAIEISRQNAIAFIEDRITPDQWLSHFFPKQMQVYYQAINQTRQRLLGSSNGLQQ